MLELRPYQKDALAALEKHFAERDDNPCVVLPTGSGKSFVIAELIRRMIERDPNFRCVVLAHRQELVDQNCQEFEGVGLEVGIGVNCVGLGRRDFDDQVVFAMINSVYRSAHEFPPINMVIVDEAHHIPISDEYGMYRKFINDVKAINPMVRIVGFTATPYRLDAGHVCHRDYVLNEVSYEANVGDLIRDNYLCKLRSKVSKLAPNLDGVSEVGGDYKKDELSERVCISELVKNTVVDAVLRLDAERRKCCVWFCVDIKHCEMVKSALLANGEMAEMVTSETPKDQRIDITGRFRSGSVRHLLNVQVFTEGFNVKQVDAIVLLRPTLSRGLYVQMVGRGLRMHTDKQDCIILDYARCIEEHGPIDQEPSRYVPMEICTQCEELFPRALSKCPKCGYVVSEEEKRKHDVSDEVRVRIRRMHGEIASCREILSKEFDNTHCDRVIVKEYIVKWVLTMLAYANASAGCEYNVKRGRLKPKDGSEFDQFFTEFVEYAQHVKLTNLPDMLKDYFENEWPHRSEILRMRREERLREHDELMSILKRQRSQNQNGSPLAEERLMERDELMSILKRQRSQNQNGSPLTEERLRERDELMSILKRQRSQNQNGSPLTEVS